MHLLRVGPFGAEKPVARHNGVHFDLTPLTNEIDGAFLANGGIARVQAALQQGLLEEVSIGHKRVGAPVARPHAVWCIGMNYAAHAAESGAQPPVQPVLFFKTPNTVVGPNDDILIPRDSECTDWEVELAVVIGRRARYLETSADAAAHIAGYTISNDVSERGLQLETSGGQWSKGKCCETFNPLGPALIPAASVSAADLRLRSWVNGELRQDSSTNDLIFSVDYLIWHLSQVAVLEPGDVVNTGTPAGVALSGRFPYLRDGDVVELEIEGLGRQRQVCRAVSAPRPGGAQAEAR